MPQHAGATTRYRRRHRLSTRCRRGNTDASLGRRAGELQPRFVWPESEYDDGSSITTLFDRLNARFTPEIVISSAQNSYRHERKYARAERLVPVAGWTR